MGWGQTPVMTIKCVDAIKQAFILRQERWGQCLSLWWAKVTYIWPPELTHCWLFTFASPCMFNGHWNLTPCFHRLQADLSYLDTYFNLHVNLYELGIGIILLYLDRKGTVEARKRGDQIFPAISILQNCRLLYAYADTIFRSEIGSIHEKVGHFITLNQRSFWARIRKDFH